MKKLFLFITLSLLVLNLQAQKKSYSYDPKDDYVFMLTSVPYLKQLYPEDRELPKEGGEFHALSYDGSYAFIYNDKYCGYFDVPMELRSGFDNSAKDLQKINSTLFWQRVKQIMSDIDAYWAKEDSLKNTKETEYHHAIVNQDVSDKKVYEVVEQMPSYPGGMKALLQYLSDNIKYPKAAEKKHIQGRVITTFVVETDGSISDVKTQNSVDPRLDAEAIRVVSKMPKWIPGRQNGKPVSVKYFLPIIFRLQ